MEKEWDPDNIVPLTILSSETVLLCFGMQYAQLNLKLGSCQARAYARGFGVNPLEFDMLQNFITCSKEINCFRMLFAC